MNARQSEFESLLNLYQNMQGEFNFNKFIGFLKSFWGLLTSIAVLLPSLIYFLKTKQISESIISEYYLSIPTTFSILIIPYLFLFEDKLSNLSFARRLSSFFFIASIITFFIFIYVKSSSIYDRDYYKDDLHTNIRTVIYEKSNGQIMEEKFKIETNGSKTIIENSRKVGSLEFICLILFTFSIISLTSSFASLGIFYYSKHNSS